MHSAHERKAQKIFYRVFISILIARCRKENRKHKYAIRSAYNAVLIKQKKLNGNRQRISFGKGDLKSKTATARVIKNIFTAARDSS